jgi:hypothetical protein
MTRIGGLETKLLFAVEIIGLGTFDNDHPGARSVNHPLFAVGVITRVVHRIISDDVVNKVVTAFVA